MVGGGDSALEEATFISRFASKVYLVHRREEFRASPIMVDRARAEEKIEFVLNKTVDEVLGETKVTGVRLRDTVTDELERARDRRVLRRHRPRPEHGALPRSARPRGRLGVSGHQGPDDGDEHPGRLRGGRCPGSRLPAGRHRSRVGMCGRARRGAVPERATARGIIRRRHVALSAQHPPDRRSTSRGHV